MYASIWSYPWDLDDLGIENSLKELRENGLNGISLITSYHAGRFLQIRSPRRKVYFPEDGVLYYPSNLSRFRGQKIQPRIGTFIREHPDFWNRLFDASEKLGMTVSGWTVCLHNTRIGMEYPDVCVHNAFGDAVYYNQCPSNPDVRLYMKTLLDDIISSLPLYSLELESMNFMGHYHEFHHEKDGIGLGALEDFLFSLCFCDSCIKRAKDEGFDIRPARDAVRKALDGICNRDAPSSQDREFLSGGFEFFHNTPELYDYLVWRSGTVSSLVEEVVTVIDRRCKVYFLSLLPHSRSWLFGVDLKRISRLCTGAVVCSYDCSTEQAAFDLEESRRDFGSAELLVGMRAFYPEYSGSGSFSEKVHIAKEKGVDGFVFYNYGLIPVSQLGWIKKGIV
ncbi:hypothetical protein FACS1894140_1980 [Spirochaetia bacterium]|nr:hypothetical protein FACS1894140_1980 [Spirochaetia bacterium]